MLFSPDYNFMSCVKTAQVAAVGCRPGWEDWSESDLPACTSLEQLVSHEKLYTDITTAQPIDIFSKTGCQPPCAFNEYSVFGDVEEGETNMMQGDALK